MTVRPPERSTRAARWAWGAAIAALLVTGVAVGQHRRRGADFRVYLTAAARFVEGADLYRESDGTMPFKYAPVTAALFVPFTVLPPRVAVPIWNALCVLALLWIARLTARGPAGEGEVEPSPWGPPLATLVLVTAFYQEIFYGQVDVAILLLLVVAAVGADRGRVWGPAAAFAVAVLLKLPVAVVGLYFVLRRRWAVVGATALVLAAMAGLVVARYGGEGALGQLREWSDLLARTTKPWALNANAQGLPTALLALVTSPGALPTSAAMLGAQIVAIALFVAGVLWARPSPPDLLALCCMAGALLSPQGWRANFVLAWPLARVVCEGRHRPNLALAGAFALLGVGVSTWAIGEQASRQVLLARPLTAAYVLLVGVVLWQVRSSGAPRARSSDGTAGRLPRSLQPLGRGEGP